MKSCYLVGHGLRRYLAGAAAARAGDEMSGPALLLLGFAVTGRPGTGSALLASVTIAGAAGGPVFGALLDRSGRPDRVLAWTLAAFAPGLAGFGLAANLSRVLFACARTRVAAAAITGGWLLVIAADLVNVPLVAGRWVVPALGLGNSIGLTVAGIALLAAVRRARGGGALRGVSRAVAAGLAGALAGAAAGAGVSAALRVAGFLPNAAVVLLACACTVLAFGLVVLAVDGGELRSLVSRARSRLAR